LGQDNADARATIDRIAAIYTAAQREHGLIGRGPSDRGDADVHWPLENHLGHLAEQQFVLNAVKVAFLRNRFVQAAFGQVQEALAEELYLSFEDWQDLQETDRRRFGTGT